MIIQLEQKHHFGIISQKEREKLRDEILKNEKKIKKQKSKKMTEFEICDQFVENVSKFQNDKQFLTKLEKYITSKYSSRNRLVLVIVNMTHRR